jgi:hypothetical protein
MIITFEAHSRITGSSRISPKVPEAYRLEDGLINFDLDNSALGRPGWLTFNNIYNRTGLLLDPRTCENCGIDSPRSTIADDPSMSCSMFLNARVCLWCQYLTANQLVIVHHGNEAITDLPSFYFRNTRFWEHECSSAWPSSPPPTITRCCCMSCRV